MSNKYKPHIWVIPEDDANRQIALGFRLHYAVDDRSMDIMGPAGGWQKVLRDLELEYVPLLQKSANTHVVLIIDFDRDADRRAQFEKVIPVELRSRVFIIGSKPEPESLRSDLGMAFEKIGDQLAQNCRDHKYTFWEHPQLAHNDVELQRLKVVVRPILFPANE